MEKLRKKLGGCAIPPLMGKKNQSGMTLQLHRLGLIESARMIKLSTRLALAAGEDVANHKEIFLLVSYQQDAQGSYARLEWGGSGPSNMA